MNVAQQIAAWYWRLTPAQQRLAEGVHGAVPDWMVESLHDVAMSTVSADLVVDGTSRPVVLMTTALREFLEQRSAQHVPPSDEVVRATVVRALARTVVGDASDDIDEAERVLATLLVRGAITMRLDMAIDSTTTALAPFVDVSFRDGTRFVKSFAELDLPDDLDIG